jgi:spermidine/putrescine transport system permease protein
MGRKAVPYLLTAPAALSVIIMVGLCFVVLIGLSLSTQNYLDIDLTWTTANYEQALTSPLIHRLLLRSALVSLVVTLISLCLAYPIAYFVAFDMGRNKLLWLILFTLPCWISYLLRILSWKLILGFNGVVNVGLADLGLIKEPLEFLLYNPASVSIALVHAWVPFAILPIYVSLEKIDRALLQASADLGEPPVWTFLRVVLPLSMPGVIAAAVLIFIPTFGDYVTPQLIGGPSGVMVGNFIATQFGASNNWPLGAAVSLLSMLIATLGVCLLIAVPRLATAAVR